MDKKLKVISVLAAAATGLLLYLYTKTSEGEQTHEEKLEQQLINLRKKVNIKQISHGDFKKVMAIGIRQARLKLSSYSNEFRERRKAYHKPIEEEKFGEYIEFLYKSVMDMDKISIQMLWEIGRRFGLSGEVYEDYQNEVQNSIKQIMYGQNQHKQQRNELKVDQAKLAIKKEIKLIREEGKKYVNRIIAVAKDWPANKLSSLQILLPIVIADAAFANDERSDAENLSHAQVKYQNQLIAQFQQLEFAMTPLMLQLNAAVRKSMVGREEKEVLPGGKIEELDELQKKQLSSYAEMAEMIEKSSK